MGSCPAIPWLISGAAPTSARSRIKRAGGLAVCRAVVGAQHPDRQSAAGPVDRLGGVQGTGGRGDWGVVFAVLHPKWSRTSRLRSGCSARSGEAHDRLAGDRPRPAPPAAVDAQPERRAGQQRAQPCAHLRPRRRARRHRPPRRRRRSRSGSSSSPAPRSRCTPRSSSSAAAVGGVCRRAGRSPGWATAVILTEETRWIGGQLTNQAVPPDEHPWIEELRRERASTCPSAMASATTIALSLLPLTAAARARRASLNPGTCWVSSSMLTTRASRWPCFINSMAPHQIARPVVGHASANGPMAAWTDSDRITGVIVRSLESGLYICRS